MAGKDTNENMGCKSCEEYRIAWLSASQDQYNEALLTLDVRHSRPSNFDCHTNANILYAWGSCGLWNIVLAGPRKQERSSSIYIDPVTCETVLHAFPNIDIIFSLGIGLGTSYSRQRAFPEWTTKRNTPGMFHLQQSGGIELGAKETVQAGDVVASWTTDFNNVWWNSKELRLVRSPNTLARLDRHKPLPKALLQIIHDLAIEERMAYLHHATSHSIGKLHLGRTLFVDAKQIADVPTIWKNMSSEEWPELACLNVHGVWPSDILNHGCLVIHGIHGCSLAISGDMLKRQAYSAAATLAKQIIRMYVSPEDWILCNLKAIVRAPKDVSLILEGDQGKSCFNIQFMRAKLRRESVASLLAKLNRYPRHDLQDYVSNDQLCGSTWSWGDYHPVCSNRTERWILRHPVYQEWSSEESSRKIVWLIGAPGCGKSRLVDRLLVDRRSKTPEDDSITSHASFGADTWYEATSTAALCCIIFQILVRWTDVIDLVLERYLEYGDILLKDFVLLWQTLLQIMDHSQRRRRRLWCFLDGLQYCRDTELMETLLQYTTSSAQTSFATKFFVSSSIQPKSVESDARLLDTFIFFKEDRRQETTQNKIVARHLHAMKGLSAAECYFVCGRLDQNPHITPVWLSIAHEALLNDPSFSSGHVRQVFSNMPQKLSEAYFLRASKILSDPKTRRMLMVALAAFRPLFVGEFFAIRRSGGHSRTLDTLVSDIVSDIETENSLSTYDVESLNNLYFPFLSRDFCYIRWRDDAARSFLLDRDIDSYSDRDPHSSLPFSKRSACRSFFNLSECHKVLAESCLDFLRLLASNSDLETKDTDGLIANQHIKLDDRYMLRYMLHSFINYSYRYLFKHIIEAQVPKTDPLIHNALQMMKHHGLGFQQTVSWDYEPLRRGGPILYQKTCNSLSLLARIASTGCMPLLEAYLDEAPSSFVSIDTAQFVQVVLTQGNIAMVRKFLDYRDATSLYSSVLSKSETFSLICLAINHQEDKIAKELIATSDTQLDHLLSHAVRGRSNVATLTWLIRAGAGLDCGHSAEMSLLCVAITTLQSSTLSYLLQNGALVNDTDVAGLAPLHYAAAVSTSGIVDILVKYGAEVNAVDHAGRTALHLAAFIGQSGTLATLLKHKPTIDGMDDAGWTPLHFAAFGNNIENAKLLLAAHHSCTITNTYGRTPFDVACDRSNVEMMDFLLNHAAGSSSALQGPLATPSYDLCVDAARIRLLSRALDQYLDHLARFLVSDAFSVTFALRHLSKSIHNRRLTRDVYWIFEKLNIEQIKGEYRGLLLHIAAANLDVKAATLVLDAGGLVDARNSRGRTPLSVVAGHVLDIGPENDRLSARRHGCEMAELLLTRQADADLRDYTQNSPLCYAIQNGNLEMIGLLALRSVWRGPFSICMARQPEGLHNLSEPRLQTQCDTHRALSGNGRLVTELIEAEDDSSEVVSEPEIGLGFSMASLRINYQLLFQPHLCQGPTTADVLARPHENAPRTIYDRLRSRKRLLPLPPIHAFASSLYMEPNFRLHPESRVVTGRQFNLSFALWRDIIRDHHMTRRCIPGLSTDITNASRVYLVTSAEKPSFCAMYHNRKHWSLYTQGCFFGLAVVPFTGYVDTNKVTATYGKISQAVLQLKREFFYDKISSGWRKVHTEHSKRVYVAFDLGLTEYNTDEITLLARHVLERLGRYNTIFADCHGFVAFLSVRLIMSVRTSAVFMGSKAQIVDWDLKLDHTSDRSMEHYQSLQTGFLIRSPTAWRERKKKKKRADAWQLLRRMYEIEELHRRAE